MRNSRVSILLWPRFQVTLGPQDRRLKAQITFSVSQLLSKLNWKSQPLTLELLGLPVRQMLKALSALTLVQDLTQLASKSSEVSLWTQVVPMVISKVCYQVKEYETKMSITLELMVDLNSTTSLSLWEKQSGLVLNLTLKPWKIWDQVITSQKTLVTSKNLQSLAISNLKATLEVDPSLASKQIQTSSKISRTILVKKWRIVFASNPNGISWFQACQVFHRAINKFQKVMTTRTRRLNRNCRRDTTLVKKCSRSGVSRTGRLFRNTFCKEMER